MKTKFVVCFEMLDTSDNKTILNGCSVYELDTEDDNALVDLQETLRKSSIIEYCRALNAVNTGATLTTEHVEAFYKDRLVVKINSIARW